MTTHDPASAAWRGRGLDVGVVALTSASALFLQPATDTSPYAWWVLVGFLAVVTGPLLLRRRWPVGAFLLTTAVLIAAADGAAVVGAKLSPLTVLSLAVALHAVGAWCVSFRATAAAVVGGAAIVAIGVAINHLVDVPTGYRGGTDVLAVLAPLPLAWAIGFATRRHLADLVSSRQEVVDVRRHQHWREQRAAARERLRIAHEMHDVVAHSLTSMVVRAESLRARSDDLPPWARVQVDGLAASGRQAGQELRDLLRVLRASDEAEVPVQPLPGLGDVASLLQRTRGEGVEVQAELSVTPDDVPRATQLAVYRVLQESLTNARRHAAGAPVRVALSQSAAGLRLEVVNARSPHPAAGGDWGAGVGLTGMRERVETVGGRLTTAATADGGFRVVVALPWAGPGEVRT